ncbi:hypothetical protein D1AOALGA4SA_945 [Olavius algarvensis Delta 1 endosymbiont]|nr:hypothetical protein D1AOALGA4SA_945 [Olavius algarvensis Delta 1 endosymbiont]
MGKIDNLGMAGRAVWFDHCLSAPVRIFRKPVLMIFITADSEDAKNCILFFCPCGAVK